MAFSPSAFFSRLQQLFANLHLISADRPGPVSRYFSSEPRAKKKSAAGITGGASDIPFVAV
jgi:hypothetical protein